MSLAEVFEMRPEHWQFTIPLRLRSLLRRAQADQDLDDELRDHLARRTEEYVAKGMTQEEAHRRARLDLGGIEQTKEICRDARRVNWIQDLIQDLRFGLHMLQKNPGFTTVAVLTLALGIGANTAVFSVVNSVLLRPLPYPDSDRLVQIWSTNPNANRWGTWTAYPRFEDWRRASTVFEEMATARTWVISIRGGDPPESLFGVISSSQLLQLLRVRPMLGRAFLPEEDQPGHDQVIILSYGLWQRRFGSDRSVIGRTV